MIAIGSIVRVKAEWLGPNESILGRYVVVEWNIDRGFITPIECDMAIRPINLVHEDMIELA